MVFQEHECGAFRIFTGAMDCPRVEGYVGGVVVTQAGPEGRLHEVFREEPIFCGHRWDKADEALEAARARGVQATLKLSRQP